MSLVKNAICSLKVNLDVPAIVLTICMKIFNFSLLVKSYFASQHVVSVEEISMDCREKSVLLSVWVKCSVDVY